MSKGSSSVLDSLGGFRSSRELASPHWLSLRGSLDAPRGIFWPAAQGFCGPNRGLVGVALGAGVWNFVFVGHRGSNDRKSMGADKDIRDSGLDLGHVASDTLTTW